MPTAMLVSAQPTAQQLVDFANAVAVVNNYAYAVTNQSLPVLQYPPPNYASFANSFTPAKMHCLNWTDNTFVAMLQLPVTIQGQAADLFTLEGTMIEAALNTLVADPANAQAKSLLASSLSTLQKNISAQAASAGSIEKALLQFVQDVQNDAVSLAGIAALATQASGQDQASIDKASKDIANLRQEIQTAQTLLAVSEIGIGLSIFVGLIGAVVCFIPGAQGVGIGLIVGAVGGLGASIAGTVIESKAITAMQNQIDSDQEQISGLGQDIILLNAVSDQFAALAKSGQAAAAALATINATWTQLDDIITEVVDELTDVNHDAGAAQYQQALTDFQAAEASWSDVVSYASALAGIDYKWQDSSGVWHSFSDSAPAPDAGQVASIPSTIRGASS
jgi:hypothetical protein